MKGCSPKEVILVCGGIGGEGSRMKLGVVAIAMVALASTGARPAAAQQTTHGCACLHNQTQVPISYRYKWGEGEW